MRFRRRPIAFIVILTAVVSGAVFLSVHSSPRTQAAPVVPIFDDVSAAAGLKTTNQNSFGMQWADYNNDGYMDFYVGRHGGCDPDLFRNNGNGTFTDVSLTSGIRVCGADRHNCVWGDLNRDLRIDLFCGVNEMDHALINQGNGTFVDQGGALGFGEDYGRSANLVDYDKNGNLDILYGGYVNLLLYKNHGTWFDRVATLTAIGNQGPRSGSIADYDMDGYEDAFIAQFPDTTWLLLHGSASGFTDATVAAGLSLTGADAGVWGDYDNDGDPDLFITEWRTFCCARNFRLMENQGNGTFVDVTKQAGLAQSAGHTGLWGDFNNDGWLDLFIVNGMKKNDGVNRPDQLYLSNGNKTFTEVAAAAGLQGPSQGSGDSAAWADYDLDGNLDILVGNGSGDLACRPDVVPPCFGPDKLYRNRGNSNKSFQARLVSNYDTYGYGTKVWATTPAGTQYREMTDGMVGKSQNAQVIHFGLGSYTEISTLRIVWPDGVEQILHDVAANTAPIVLQEGSGVVGQPTPVPTIVPDPTPTPTPIAPLADLAVTTVKAPPATAARGATFTTADTTKNVGNVTAPTTVTAYYLSNNRVPGLGDIRLGETHSVPQLAPGAQSWASVVVTIPQSTPPGKYYIIAYADDTNLVPEIDDFLNNFHSSGSILTVQ